MGEQIMASRGRLFTMRMTEEESAQLEGVAQSYGLTSAGLIRMLVHREAAESVREHAVTDPLREGEHTEESFYILRAIKDLSAEKPAATDEIAYWLHTSSVRVGLAFARVLNELRSAGYIRKTRGGYVLTAKGEAGAKFKNERETESRSARPKKGRK